MATEELRKPAVSQVGQYQLIEEVGRGGMAIVYRAHHPGLGIDVAVKVISTQFASDPNFVARFRLEAQSVARLRHPNILQVYDFGEDNGVAYLVSQYVDGGSLWDKLGSPLSTHYVNQVATQVASALDYAHGHGILHRDIKPGNILLTKEGDPILADFGLAKILERPSHLTDVGTILGSPEYMSPEQALGQEMDERSDVYSMAVVLYEMLTGSPPFEFETPTRTILAHAYDPLPSPRTKNPDLSEQTERVLYKSLAKDPAERYQRAGEMIHALKVASITLTSKPKVASWPPRPLDRAEPAGGSPAVADAAVPATTAPSRPRPRWFLPAAVAAPLILLLLVGTLLFAQSRPKTATVRAPGANTAALSAADAAVIVVIAPFDDSAASKKLNVGQRINDKLLIELGKQGFRNVELLPLPGGNSVAPKTKALEAIRDLAAPTAYMVWGWYDDQKVSPHTVLLRGDFSTEMGDVLNADLSQDLTTSNSEDVLNNTMPSAVSVQIAKLVGLTKR